MKYCKYCKNVLKIGDKFCRYCGKKRCEAQGYRPEHNVMAVIYGPPYEAKYVCPNCGEVYIESGFGSASERYCTKCGAKQDLIGGGDSDADFDFDPLDGLDNW